MDEAEIEKLSGPFEMWLRARFQPSTAYQYLMGIRSLLRAAPDVTPEGIRLGVSKLKLGAQARSGPALRQFLLHLTAATGSTASLFPTQQLAEAIGVVAAATVPAKTKKPAFPREAAQAVVDIVRVLDSLVSRMSTAWYMTAGMSNTTRNMDLRFRTWTAHKLNPRRCDAYDVLAVSTWENIRQIGPEGQTVMFDAVQLGGPLDDYRVSLRTLMTYGGWTLTGDGPNPRPLIPRVPRAFDAFTARELRKVTMLALRE